MANVIYNLFFKRTSGFILCGVMMALGFETFVNITGDKIFYTINKGLLWDDIKDNYVKSE